MFRHFRELSEGLRCFSGGSNPRIALRRSSVRCALERPRGVLDSSCPKTSVWAVSRSSSAEILLP